MLCASIGVNAQTKPVYQRTPDGPNIIADANLKVNKYLIVPVSSASGIPGGSPDSAGYFRYNDASKKFQGYYGPVKGWADLGGSEVFTADIPVRTTNGIGKYANNTTIPAIGKTAQQVLTDIVTQVIAPTYNAPTISLSSAPGFGTYEYGTKAAITLSSNFSQNDGGAVQSLTYYKNGVALTGNTDSLTINASYSVVASYAQGPCKNNNLGQQDCTGRINANSAVSGTQFFNGQYGRYYGFVSSTNPGEAEINSLTKELSSSKSKTFTIAAPSTPKYLCFAYVATAGSTTAININGFPSIDAFTQYGILFKNSLGYTYTLILVISKNAFTSNSGTTTAVFN